MEEMEKGVDNFVFTSFKAKLINPLNDSLINDKIDDKMAFDIDESLKSSINITSGVNSEVFKPIEVNELFFKNRLCFIGFSDEYFISEDGKINDDFFEYYRKVSMCNVGTIFTGGFDLSYKSLIKFSSRLQDKITIEKFKNFTRDIHSFGAKIFMKIKSIFGRGDYNNRLLGVVPFSTNFHKSYFNTNLNSVRLSDKLINNIIDEMANLSVFSSDCGFDGILIDGDLFGLIGEISSPEINKRSLGYFSETHDFITKLLAKILNHNKDTSIFYNISYKTFIDDVFDKEIKNIKTANSFKFKQTLKKFIKNLVQLVNLGVDGFIFNNGTFETEFLSSETELMSDNIFKDFYTKIDNYFRENQIKNKFGNEIVFIYKDKFDGLDIDPKLSLKENFLFDITKQILAENDIIKKTLNHENIRNCIRCGYCTNKFNKKNAVRCIINPAGNIGGLDGKNRENNASYMKNIAIIGAGVSGVNCAIFLAERGFSVDLFDKNNELLKNNRLREFAGYNKLIKLYNSYLENEVNKFVIIDEKNNNIDKNESNQLKNSNLSINYNSRNNKKGLINLYLNEIFSEKTHQLNKYDTIIIATGSREKFLTISGAVLKNVISTNDVLLDENILSDKKNIVIIAKTELSLLLSQWLLLKGKNITLVFESLEFLLKMQNSRLTYFLYSLNILNCKVFPFAKVNKIEHDFVELSINSKIRNESFVSVILNYKSGTNYKYEERVKNIDSDFVIYEPETSPNNKLYYDLVQAGFSGNLFMIGDALYSCDLDESIKTAYFVAKNI